MAYLTRACECGRPVHINQVKRGCDECKRILGSNAAEYDIIAYLTDTNGGSNLRQVAANTGISVRHTLRVLRHLIRVGRVVSSTDDGLSDSGISTVYFISNPNRRYSI